MDDAFTRSLTGSSTEPVVRLSRAFAAPPSEVWSAITDPARLARWLGTIDGEPASGAFLLRVVDAPDQPAHVRVEHCAPERSLRLAWQWEGEAPSRLSAMVDGDETHTVLTLEHRLGEATYAHDYGGGWEQHLTELAGLWPGAPAVGPVNSTGGDGPWRGLVERALTVEIDIAADRSDVWTALATEAGLRRWWWRHWDDVSIVADVCAGNVYRFTAPGAGITVSGEYIDVEPEEHLSFTWQWSDESGTSTDESCDIRLTDSSHGCRVTVRHTGPWSDDTAAIAYRQGWEFVLSELASTR